MAVIPLRGADGNSYSAKALASPPSPPDPPDMEPRIVALEAAVGRIEPKLDKLDDRVRILEIAVSKMDGKLDLLVGKIPSWWQQPLGVVAVIGALAAAIGLAHTAGLLK